MCAGEGSWSGHGPDLEEGSGEGQHGNGALRRSKGKEKQEQQLQKMHASAREFFRMVYFLFSKLRDKALFGPVSPSLMTSRPNR